MNLIKITLVISLVVFSTTATAAKQPDPNDCPCYAGYPGLVFGVNEITNQTCVVTLDRERVVIANSAMNWYLDAETPTGQPCLHMQTQKNLAWDNHSCYIKNGVMTSNGYCSPETVDDHERHPYLTEDELAACEYALKSASRYLETMSMCE